MSYESETYKLFSHRPDIKAKRNYIRIRQREKERAKANAMFADTTMTFLMMVSFIVFVILCCVI